MVSHELKTEISDTPSGLSYEFFPHPNGNPSEGVVSFHGVPTNSMEMSHHGENSELTSRSKIFLHKWLTHTKPRTRTIESMTMCLDSRIILDIFFRDVQGRAEGEGG